MSREWKKVREGASLLCIQEEGTPERTAGGNGLRHRRAGPAWTVDRVADFREVGSGWRRGDYVIVIFFLIIRNNIWSLATFWGDGGHRAAKILGRFQVLRMIRVLLLC